MGRAEINEDPTAGDFFNVDALHNTADGLVREAIQNSLDAKARDNPSPVRIHISFVEHAKNVSETKIADGFLNGLWDHVNACDATHGKYETIYWLTIEDFGTRGLVGDAAAADDPKPGERNDFYYFWRNIGRGKKEGTERGRWGLGKTMFPATSRIHTFFGLTKRINDKRGLLMGQSVLRIHRIDDKKYYPYGYYGNVDPTDGFVLPIDDAQTIHNFTQAFRLTRGDEAGLSVVIPYYAKETLNFNDVKSSVLKHYFFPILSGELVVEISADAEKVLFTKISIRQIARDLLASHHDGFDGMLDLATEFLSLAEKDMFVAKEQVVNRSPMWSEELFSGEKLDALAEQFDSGSMISLKIPIYITPKGKEHKKSYFHLVLKRDPELDQPMDVYIRQGITISGVTSLREAGVRALVIATEEHIATFLGDSENPAHTEWQARSRKFQGQYSIGPSTLEFVKEAPRGMMRLLNRRSELVDDTALRHVFPAPNSYGKNNKEQKGPANRDPTKVVPPEPKISTRPKVFQLSRTLDGFTVTLADSGKTSLPLVITTRCAYDTGSGNPFKRWVKSDFDFQSDRQLELEGGEWLERTGNKLRITVNSDSFSLRANGFDPNRDLIVDARLEVQPNA